jgi:hypothetical protein
VLTATVKVNLDHAGDELTFDLDRADRAALQYLGQIPDAAHLVVVVGKRELLMPSAVRWLAEHSRRLHVEISASTPHAARRWYDAIKSGECP